MSAYVGPLTAPQLASEYNEFQFFVRQILARATFVREVQVTAVHSNGVGVTGTVDVQPMVHQVDGNGKITPHGIVHGLPFCRIQGGTNAIIMDPAVNDIGIAVFADRDVSRVVATRAPAAPGSDRQHNWADGFYFSGFLNGTPTQYVEFTSAGIKAVSPTAVTLQAPAITLDGNVQSTGTFTNKGVNISSTHVHSDPQGGTTGTPQ